MFFFGVVGLEPSCSLKLIDRNLNFLFGVVSWSSMPKVKLPNTFPPARGAIGEAVDSGCVGIETLPPSDTRVASDMLNVAPRIFGA